MAKHHRNQSRDWSKEGPQADQRRSDRGAKSHGAKSDGVPQQQSMPEDRVEGRDRAPDHPERDRKGPWLGGG